MALVHDEILALVQEAQLLQSETSSLEVKSAAGGSPTRSLRESLSAFSNQASGGVVLLGLDEAQQFEIVGVSDLNRIQTDIANACEEIEPPVRVEISSTLIDGKRVVAIEVPETSLLQKPSHIRASGLQSGSYIRSANSNRRMTTYEIFSYLSNREHPSFDTHPVLEATVADLDEERIRRYFQHLRQARPDNPIPSMPFEEATIRSGIVADVNGKRHPTLAGLLVFGIFPQELKPQLRIVFNEFAGNSTTDYGPRGERFVDDKVFEGPIETMVPAAVRHIMSSLRKSSLIEGLLRTEIPEYPEVVIREAIVNAVAHRDLSPMAIGSYIHVRIFTDRLEIESPGGLFGPVTVENIESTYSTRNSKLMEFLEYTQVNGGYLAENRGSGIDLMLDSMRRAQLEPPLFRDSRVTFTVSLKNHTLLDPVTIAWLNQFAGHRLSTNQRIALAFIANNGLITNSDLRRLTGLDMQGASRELRGLADAAIVRQIGTKRGAKYVLGSSLSGMPALIQVDAMILDFVQREGSVSNSQVRDLLGYDIARANRTLNRMVTNGILQPIGKGRWTTYVLRSDT